MYIFVCVYENQNVCRFLVPRTVVLGTPSAATGEALPGALGALGAPGRGPRLGAAPTTPEAEEAGRQHRVEACACANCAKGRTSSRISFHMALYMNVSSYLFIHVVIYVI